MRLSSWLRSLLLWNACGLALLAFVAFFFLHPPAQLYYSPLAMQQPYANLPTWGAQELYHNPVTRSVLFDGHRDRIVDWSVPEAHCLYRLVERLANWSDQPHCARTAKAWTQGSGEAKQTGRREWRTHEWRQAHSSVTVRVTAVARRC